MLFIFIIASKINICISQDSSPQEDCQNWLPSGQSPNYILPYSTNFSGISISPGDSIVLGIGNTPNLEIDLSSLYDILGPSQYVDLSIQLASPEKNNVVSFDLEEDKYKNLNSLEFNELNLKPYNSSIVHSLASINHACSIAFNYVTFLSGYAFDSENLKSMCIFTYYDISIVELKERRQNNNVGFITAFRTFRFLTDKVYSNDGTNDILTFENTSFLGTITVVSDYIGDTIDFVLASTDELPRLGFIIYSSANSFRFSGGWHENITLDNHGIQIVYNGSDTIHILSNIMRACEENTHLPIAVKFDTNTPYVSQSNGQTPPSIRKIDIDSCIQDLTITAPWNITGETQFTRNSKTNSITFEHLIYSTGSAAVYRTDVSNKVFFVERLTINDNLTLTYPGNTDINIIGDFEVRPGSNLTINSKLRFDKNRAIFKIYWDMISGFPTINILDPAIITSKGLPTIVFTDEEPLSNIGNAANVYGDVVGAPIKILCGLGISEIDRSKFRFDSPNPSFSENGVWRYFWALDNNGEPTGTDNTTQNLCLWVNMTDFPEIPIIPLPTASKDPAAVNRKAMIAMIVIFVFLFVSGVLGYFTKFLKQNRRDREKEKQEELDKLQNEKGISDEDSNFNDSEVTQQMSESDLSDHAVSFVHDLEIGSDDDFSASSAINESISQNITPRKSHFNDSISVSESEVKTDKKKKKKNKSKKSKANKTEKSNDDVNTPLLNQSDGPI